MGNNLLPYSLAIGEDNLYFLTPGFEFTKREKIENNKSMERNENSVHLFDYRDSNCIKDLFKKRRIYKIHSNYDD